MCYASILTSDRIEVYDLNNMSHECDLPLQDTSFTYCKVAGRDDNYVVVIAIRDEIEYSGHYDIKNQACYLAEGTIKGNNNSLRKVLGNSGFFIQTMICIILLAYRYNISDGRFLLSKLLVVF